MSGALFKKTTNRLKKISKLPDNKQSLLSRIGQKGVDELSKSTPRDSGEAASAWYYRIETVGKGQYNLKWYNKKILSGGVPLVLLLQYGHGTRSGSFVPGRDFINPALVGVYSEFKTVIAREVRTI